MLLPLPGAVVLAVWELLVELTPVFVALVDVVVVETSPESVVDSLDVVAELGASVVVEVAVPLYGKWLL